MTEKKIFILDDDRDILDSMRMVLEFKGYQVHTSAHPQNLHSISEEEPDLLLIDLWMSGIDGSDICRQLKDNVRTKHIPVIIISANANVKELSYTCKADGYISKPFEIDELLSTVQQYTRDPDKL